jgi:membrane-associated phospholipid phosphatase
MISAVSSLDLHVLQVLYAMREPHAVLGFIWVSQLGEWYVIGGVGLCAALWLAQGIILAVATSAVATALIKILVHRARPDAYFQAYTETSYSFPSAHAAMSFAFYGFLAWMVWHSRAPRMARGAAAVLLAVLILLIGFSRLYLGIHYPSDVLAGYALGAPCLWFAVWTAKTLRNDTMRS